MVFDGPQKNSINDATDAIINDKNGFNMENIDIENASYFTKILYYRTSYHHQISCLKEIAIIYAAQFT
ncbi:hypothetical protein LPB140_03715 [Sphingorhabdus lutea]|uniref:Uncharacterized protein n=1 Tax=Sphingorhabdus lutea TaxID=1913578 RepID=A0A1L3JAB6_9SPHN|nr:hypothetical protein LPB140_03715 [Sphingorhabdus lutea]